VFDAFNFFSLIEATHAPFTLNTILHKDMPLLDKFNLNLTELYTTKRTAKMTAQQFKFLRPLLS
jgi:hypothetical protein